MRNQQWLGNFLRECALFCRSSLSETRHLLLLFTWWSFLFIRLFFFFLFVLAFAGRLLKQNHLLLSLSFKLTNPSTVFLLLSSSLLLLLNSHFRLLAITNGPATKPKETIQKHMMNGLDSYMTCANVRLLPSRFSSPLETLVSSVQIPFRSPLFIPTFPFSNSFQVVWYFSSKFQVCRFCFAVSFNSHAHTKHFSFFLVALRTLDAACEKAIGTSEAQAKQLESSTSPSNAETEMLWQRHYSDVNQHVAK